MVLFDVCPEGAAGLFADIKPITSGSNEWPFPATPRYLITSPALSDPPLHPASYFQSLKFITCTNEDSLAEQQDQRSV